MANDKIRIGLTQGDTNGVGTEVTLKALANPDILELFTPVVFGSAALFNSIAKNLGLDEVEIRTISATEEPQDGVINLIDVGASNQEPTPGLPSREGGKAAVDALEAAAAAFAEGIIDLLVTAPIDKNTAQGENFNFPGHT